MPIDPEVVEPAVQMVSRATDVESLHLVDTASLRRELARALQVTAENLIYLAAVWRELEKRGEDLSALRHGLGAHLSEIAAGRLDAEIVVQFARAPSILRTLAQLPVRKQRQLARGEPLKIVEATPYGSEPAVRAAPAYHLKASEIRLAIGNGKIRSIEEQTEILRATAALEPGVERAEAPGAGVPVRRVMADIPLEAHAHLRAAAVERGTTLGKLLRQILVDAAQGLRRGEHGGAP